MEDVKIEGATTVTKELREEVVDVDEKKAKAKTPQNLTVQDLMVTIDSTYDGVPVTKKPTIGKKRRRGKEDSSLTCRKLSCLFSNLKNEYD